MADASNKTELLNVYGFLLAKVSALMKGLDKKILKLEIFVSVCLARDSKLNQLLFYNTTQMCFSPVTQKQTVEVFYILKRMQRAFCLIGYH